MSKTESGKNWENVARSYLEQQGYKIIEQNFRTKFGEVDLIGLEGNCLVFIEVKARSSGLYGLPEEAVSERKLQTIAKVGELYRSLHPGLPELERIDVVAIDFEGDNTPKRIEIFENAGF